MVVTSAANTSDCFIGIIVIRSVSVCAGATYVLVHVIVVGYMSVMLAFGTAYGFSFVHLDSDQVSVNVQAYFDQFVGGFRVVDL